MKILTTSVLGLMALAMSAQANVPASQNVPNNQHDIHGTTDTPTSGAIDNRVGTDATTTGSTMNRSTTTSQRTTTSTSMDSIKQAQAALNSELTVGLTEDGIMGPATRAAVRQFQTEQGLSVSGQLDTATLQALGVSQFDEMDRAPASVPNSQAPSPDSATESNTNF